MKITTDVLVEVGANEIEPPKKRGDKYTTSSTGEPGKALLVAIVHTPYGEHFKEVYSQSVLNEIRSAPLASQFYELNEISLARLREKVKGG